MASPRGADPTSQNLTFQRVINEDNRQLDLLQSKRGYIFETVNEDYSQMMQTDGAKGGTTMARRQTEWSIPEIPRQHQVQLKTNRLPDKKHSMPPGGTGSRRWIKNIQSLPHSPTATSQSPSIDEHPVMIQKKVQQKQFQRMKICFKHRKGE